MDAVFPITSREAAAVLANPELTRLLKSFMNEARSCSAVAHELQVTVGWLHYRLQKLVTVGLLEVVGENKRRGKPIRLYRAVGRKFVIPGELLPDQLLDDLRSSQFCKNEFEDAIQPFRREPLGDITLELLSTGALTWTPESGPIDMSNVQEPVLDHHTSALYLSKSEALELRRELRALIRRYEGRHGEHRFGLKAGLVPLDWPVDGQLVTEHKK